jgi:hypothetical protein
VRVYAQRGKGGTLKARRGGEEEEVEEDGRRGDLYLHQYQRQHDTQQGRPCTHRCQ